jgi:hypothetical protein
LAVPLPLALIVAGVGVAYFSVGAAIGSVASSAFLLGRACGPKGAT